MFACRTKQIKGNEKLKTAFAFHELLVDAN